MQVSVVIPMYNATRTIVGCIESCLMQTAGIQEIIVVDDASTDDSVSKVKNTFGGKIHLIELLHNSGPAQARNTGWDKASGDYVAFLDSDDHWHPQKIELCVSALQNNSDALLLWHDYEVKGAQVVLHQNPVPVLKTSFLRLLVGNVVSTSCLLIKKNIAVRFNKQMRYCEDYDVALQIAKIGTVVRLPLVLTFIDRPVLSPGGLSSNRWQMRRGEMRAYQNLARNYPRYVLALPFLHLWSLVKHVRGMLK